MSNKNQEYLVQKIRSRYVEQEPTDLDTLKELDRKVRRPAAVFAYIFGSIAALIMGAGMSLIMTDIAEFVGIENPLVYGLIIGIVGMLLALANYPIYNGILGARQKKYADKIIALSDKLTNR